MCHAWSSSSTEVNVRIGDSLTLPNLIFKFSTVVVFMLDMFDASFENLNTAFRINTASVLDLCDIVAVNNLFSVLFVVFVIARLSSLLDALRDSNILNTSQFRSDFHHNLVALRH